MRQNMETYHLSKDRSLLALPTGLTFLQTGNWPLH